MEMLIKIGVTFVVISSMIITASFTCVACIRFCEKRDERNARRKVERNNALLKEIDELVAPPFVSIAIGLDQVN